MTGSAHAGAAGRHALLALLCAVFASPAAAQQSNTTYTPGQTITITLPITTETVNFKLNEPGQSIKVSPASTDIKVVSIQAPQKSGPLCGGVVNGKPQPSCGALPAKFESAAVGSCPAGSFFDIGKWECWTCPAGYSRSVFAVDSDRACTKPDASIRGKFGPASFKGPLCPAGSFHDPIRGGECYSCPSGYKRSLAHIDAGNACFIPGGERLSKATRHQKTIFAWDCKDGRFWDGWDGGNCWTCPGGYNRTANHINSAQACSQGYGEQQAKATLVKQAKCETGEFHDLKIPGQQNLATGGGCWTCPREPQQWDRTVFPIDGQQACELGGGYAISKGTFVKSLTCPSGQVFDFINLTAEDIRTRPELKGKNVQPIVSGTCWTCPTGYDRTMAHVKNADACAAKTMGWFTVPLNEPGLFGMAGASAVLLDITRRQPALIQSAIKTAGESAAKSNNTSAATLIEKEKGIFVSAPQNSTAAAGAVFVRLLSALADPKKASPAEKQLIESFKAYVIKRRTHIAQDALDQYDAWKVADDYYRGERSKQPQGMTVLFDYGTVPPDFSRLALLGSIGSGVASQAVGIAVGSLPVVGDVIGVALSAAGSGFADFSDPGSAVKFGARQAIEIAIGKAAEQAVQMMAKAAAQKITQDAIALGLVKGVPQAASRVLAAAGSAGPQIIIGASLMIISIAVDQVEQIQNARPKLLTSLATAKADPNLPRLASTENGVAELTTYWAYALGGDTTMPSSEYASFASLAPAVVASVGSTQQAVPATAQAAVNWGTVQGAANDIDVGANGKVWHIGTNAEAGGFGIYRLDGNAWTKIPGGAVRIAVDPQGNAWVANDKQQIYRYDGKQFVVMPGLARDIAVGANGAVWHIGTNAVAGGYGIYRWNGSGWTNVPGGAVRIAVDAKGNAAVVNDRGEIYSYNGSQFIRLPGAAKDIGIGAQGHVWVLGTAAVGGGYEVFYWGGTNWTKVSGGLTGIAVAPDGKPWGMNSSKQIYRAQ